MTPILNSKLPQAGTTIFTHMSALAQTHNALNLAQGFPGFEPSPEIWQGLQDACKKGLYQYAPMPGYLPLRESIAKNVFQRFGFAADPQTEITITAGGTQALYSAFTALVETGDRVAYFEPAYDSYHPAIVLNGGIPVPLALQGEQFEIPWDSFERELKKGLKAIVINSPHNPSGSLLSAQDLTKLGRLIENHTTFVISDEVYEHIVFDGQFHAGVLQEPLLKDRSIVVSSFGKTYHVTGFKLGYAVAASPIMKEFRKIHQFQVFAVHSASQHMFYLMMQNPKHHEELGSFYAGLRDAFRMGLEGSAWELLPCKGTYFQLIKMPDSLSNMTDLQAAEWLCQEKGLALIPLSPFYSDGRNTGYLRACFAKPSQQLVAATDILRTIS